MYNVASKTVTAIILSFLCVLMAACDGGKQRREAAEALLAEAEGRVEAKDFAHALELIDTLNTSYHDQTDVRRASNRVRALAIEGITVDSIGECELRLARLQVKADSLAAFFRDVEGTRGLAGYRVDKSVWSSAQLNATCVQPRVDVDGYFYLIANLQGRNIGLASVAFSDGASEVVSEPRQCVSVEGSELLSLNQEVMTPLVEWLLTHQSAGTLSFRGSKGESKVKLTPQAVTAILRSYDYALTLQEHRQALIRREKLERALATARNQLANATAE